MKLKTNLKFISRKTIALLIIVAFLLPSFGLIIMVAAEEQTFQNITVDTAYQVIKKEKKYPNLIILDVRTPCEYEKGHLYDAILMPYYNEQLEAISELEGYKNSEIIVYCKSGYRSTLASEILVENGFTNIYNMLGGILAWIDADYPIWTTQHYITVDGIEEPIIQIEPLLLYQTGCSSCTDNQESSDNSEPITITSTVLEEEENYTEILFTIEIDDNVIEGIIAKTLLFNYKDITEKINRTVDFIFTEITIEEWSLAFYTMTFLVQHVDYNLTLYTFLTPLNSEIYNNSFTIMSYEPADKFGIISMEFVKFDFSTTLSEQYAILGKVAKKIGNIYKHNEDDSVKNLSQGYDVMIKEAKLLSNLVKNQLPEYDKPIKICSAILQDDFWSCFWCELICGIVVGAGLVAACIAFPGFCWIALALLELEHWSGFLGCRTACELLELCP